MNNLQQHEQPTAIDFRIHLRLSSNLGDTLALTDFAFNGKTRRLLLRIFINEQLREKYYPYALIHEITESYIFNALRKIAFNFAKTKESVNVAHFLTSLSLEQYSKETLESVKNLLKYIESDKIFEV